MVNYVLDLPFGPGRRFLGNTNGFVGGLVGGWSVNGVTTLQAGLPLAFSATPNLVGFGYGLRPNVVDDCDKTVSGSEEERLNRWFNTACYIVPNAAFVAADPASDPRLRWALGNAERVDPDLRAHGVHNWNFAVSKQTRLAGRVNLTLRAEAFNLFNRVQFGPPNTTASTDRDGELRPGDDPGQPAAPHPDRRAAVVLADGLTGQSTSLPSACQLRLAGGRPPRLPASASGGRVEAKFG